MVDEPPEPPVRRYREINDGTQVTGKFEVKEFDPAAVMYECPEYPALDKQSQLMELRNLENGHKRRHVSTNIACVENHRRIVDGLDATQPSPPPVRLLAVGRDDSTRVEGDLSLNDEVARVDVTGYDDNGVSIDITTVISVGEANVDVSSGEALREAGLYAGAINNEDSYFLNSSLFSQEIDKDETVIATVTATLTYDAA